MSSFKCYLNITHAFKAFDCENFLFTVELVLLVNIVLSRFGDICIQYHTFIEYPSKYIYMYVLKIKIFTCKYARFKHRYVSNSKLIQIDMIINI